MYDTPTHKNMHSDYYNISASPIQPVNSNKFYLSKQSPKNKYDYGMFSKRYIPKDNNLSITQNFQKSRVTNSTMGGLLNNQQLYSQQMIFLLSDQENNINYFKQKIDSERVKIQRDFQNMKKQLIHSIEDLKISFQAELTKAYKDFMQKYQEFKSQMLQLKKTRNLLIRQNQPDLPPNEYLHQLNTSKLRNNVSNRDILFQIQKDAKLFRNQKLYTHISQLQKQMLEPAKKVTQQLIALGGIQTQYYKQKQTRELINRIVQIFQSQIKAVYGDILDHYVISTDKMIKIYRQTKQTNNMVLNGLSQDRSINNYAQFSKPNFKSLDNKDLLKKHETPLNSLKFQQSNYLNQYGLSINKDKFQDKKNQRPSSNSIDYLAVKNYKTKQYRGQSQYTRQRPNSQYRVQNKQFNRNYHMGQASKPTSNRNLNSKNELVRISKEQQNLIANWIQDITIKEVAIIDAFQNNDSILCCSFASNSKYLITGGKDKLLRVYDVNTGKLVHALQGHSASICSIATHQNYIITGGDHGCCSLIIWDIQTWTIKSKITAHSAAVTSIIDLNDSRNIVSGSYDRKINIYDYRRGQTILSLDQNNCAVACMTLTGDNNKLVTSGLDSSITIWRIFRRNNLLQTVSLQNKIMNSSLPCSLKSVKLNPTLIIIGTKQGKIQIIDIQTGQTIKKLAVNAGSLIQLVLFQRQNKPNLPLVISCSPKQKILVLTKTQTGVNSFLDVKGRLNIDFGCGIGPKIVLSENKLMAILSQSSMAKQILLYQINLF